MHREADEIDAVEDGLPWRKGDLACKVETAGHYGEATLAKFCEEQEWHFPAVQEYRRISAAYPQKSRVLDFSYGVYQAFAAQPDRLDLIASRDDWTVREARDAESYRAAR